MILHPLQFDDLLAAVPHAAAVLEPGGRVIRVNQAWRSWWARATGEADVVGLGVNFLEACTTSDGPGVDTAVRTAAGIRAVAAGDLAAVAEEFEWALLDANRPVRLTITPLGTDHASLLVSVIDLSTAHDDPASAVDDRGATALGRPLPDRTIFLGLAQHSAALASRHGFSVGVLALAVDGLEEVSAQDGAPRGAELRRILIARLLSTVRPADVVAETGRASFLVLLPDAGTAADAESVAFRLVAELRRSIRVGDVQYAVRPRVGVAVMPTGGRADAVVEHAEDAVEQARLGVGSSIAIANVDGWSVSLPAVHLTDEAAAAGEAVRIDLAEAPTDLGRTDRLVEEHLLAYFQPIVDLSDRSIVAAEALLRWRHPHYGVLSAGEFLGLELNESHRSVLAEQALVCAAEAWAEVLNQISGPVPHLFLNLTPDQLRNRHSLDRLGHLLIATGIPTDDVVVEITEAAMDAPFGELIDALGDLRQLGVRLALDDFGAGFSSLGRLRHLPVDVVKIDRQMTQGIDIDRRARQLLSSMLTMARELGLECIVEGCETEAEAAALADLGVQFVQGFALGVPMSARDLLGRLSVRSLVTA